MVSVGVPETTIGSEKCTKKYTSSSFSYEKPRAACSGVGFDAVLFLLPTMKADVTSTASAPPLVSIFGFVVKLIWSLATLATVNTVSSNTWRSAPSTP